MLNMYNIFITYLSSHLFICCNGATNKAGKSQRQNDQKSPLTNSGCCLLNLEFIANTKFQKHSQNFKLYLAGALQCWILIRRPRGFNQGEGGHSEHDDGHVLTIHQTWGQELKI